MNILSLFDGMSCGQIALERSGIKYNKYFSSEIDKHAIKETQCNYPNTIQLGDVRFIQQDSIKDNIDLLLGGSPCKSLSFAGKRNGMSTKDSIEVTTLDQYLNLKEEGFEFDGQSYLFWEYVRILQIFKPKYFLFENVFMQRHWEDIISNTLGVPPVTINSALVSAQNRVRLYWTDIPNVQPPDNKNIKLADILETTDMLNPGAIRGRRMRGDLVVRDNNKHIPRIQCLEVRPIYPDKSNCVTTVNKDNILTSLPFGRYKDPFNSGLPFRYYTCKEYCRLQTVPEDYFKVSSNSQIREMLANGWTVDIITHIFKNL